MASPSILKSSDEFDQYGVDPNSATGWDTANNRYNTKDPNTYLYHGTIGDQTGWYASNAPYSAGASVDPGAASQTPDGQTRVTSSQPDTPAGPAPSILSNDQISQYGVDPNSATNWDPTNNRYNTSTPGTYLYHGDLGAGQIGWYAGASPYAAGGGSAAGAGGAAPTDPSVASQGNGAQTYSATPGAAPTQTTTNQGTQDVVRNSLLAKATQDTHVDTNDPNFRQQADTFAAAQERARRNASSDNAAQLAGSGQVGAQATNDRMINEQAAQNSASFEAQLVGNELKNKRAEVADAISQLSGLVTGDQMRALQKQLADIDAQIKQSSLDQSTALGGRELDIKSMLGQGGLNVDLMRLLLQNQQFNNDLGYRIGSDEAHLDQQSVLSLLGN